MSVRVLPTGHSAGRVDGGCEGEEGREASQRPVGKFCLPGWRSQGRGHGEGHAGVIWREPKVGLCGHSRRCRPKPPPPPHHPQAASQPRKGAGCHGGKVSPCTKQAALGGSPHSVRLPLSVCVSQLCPEPHPASFFSLSRMLIPRVFLNTHPALQLLSQSRPLGEPATLLRVSRCPPFSPLLQGPEAGVASGRKEGRRKEGVSE